MSMLIQGNEYLSAELRLRTCIELSQNQEFYINHPDIETLKIPTYSGKKYQSKEAVYHIAAFSKESSNIYELNGFSKALENEITRTSVKSNFCGIMQVMGLASVVGKKIRLFYPNQNFRFLKVFQIEFRPRTGLKHNSSCNLMWTNSNGYEGASFVANHFVPLVVVTKHLNANTDATICHESKSVLNFVHSNSKSENSSFHQFAQQPMNMLPLQMDQNWNTKIGKNVISNRKKDIMRSKDCCVEQINDSLEEAVDKVLIKFKETTGKEKEHIHAIQKGRYIIENGPLVVIQDIVKYRGIKQLNSNSNIMFKKQIKETSLTVRRDMTVQKQHGFHRRVSSKRKINEMRMIAEGIGAKVKFEFLPKLQMLLKGLIVQICSCY